MKVAVIGGGSTYTPELVSGLAAHSPTACPLSELVLLDPDPSGARSSARLARRILDRAGLARNR